MARPKTVAVWDGEAFVPEARFRWQCDQDYVVGQKYRIDIVEERSAASHAHYMASINDAWQNLPEDQAKRFPSPDHLRKWALVQCGYYSEDSIVCDTKKDAMALAALMRRMDHFAVITLRGRIVTRYTSDSQSARAMDKDTFQKSKNDVLDLLASMIGVKQKELGKN